MPAIIGTFYKTEKEARKSARDKNKIWRKDTFVILKCDQGYLVVSKRQLEN